MVYPGNSSQKGRPGKSNRTGRLKRRRISRYIYNWLTLSGLLIVSISLFLILIVFLLEFFSGLSSSYLGIVYLILLTGIFLGMFMVPVGMLIEKRAQTRGATSIIFSRWTIDFSKKAHRNIVITFILSSILIALCGGVGTYKAYHLTEKTDFCGSLCHVVMKPEWTTYQNSAHARVKCVECHIGPGAGWYIRSKASGIRQVLAVMKNSFPRPIPTPITNLRPAQDTCEECHWPGRFIGYRETIKNYYLADEKNTPHNLRLLMNIGGQRGASLGGGIHYHMLMAGRIEYIARDDNRQEIPFVRITRKDGSKEEFNNNELPLTKEEKSQFQTRVLDCMDCHNRPAHQFNTPGDTVNTAMASGEISTALPFIKREAVRSLDGEYASTDEAITAIASQLREFYKKNYPAIFSREEVMLSRAIDKVQNIYRNNIFPEMKVSWHNYPNNLGHREWPGCFRCHNDSMVSENGNKLFRDCNTCHLILTQDANQPVTEVDFNKGLSFTHPADGETFDEFVNCNECHSLGSEIYE
ncbi:MAG: NapC/NirT family cytochrome c [Desulfobulbaceae bacterium]|nr:NapC/NirT family cytochrome c [Desulfobulbaceae bacterium]